MNRLLVVLACAFCLSIAAPSANASNIRLWPKGHKDPSKTAEAPKPKTKKSIFHRAKSSAGQAGRTEATYGMTGPKSVGWRHPEPGPAGYGAK